MSFSHSTHNFYRFFSPFTLKSHLTPKIIRFITHITLINISIIMAIGLYAPPSFSSVAWAQPPKQVHIQSANIPTPGMTIMVIASINKKTKRADTIGFCTLGFIARDNRTHELYGITAGHCYPKGSDPTVYYHTFAGSWVPFGHYTFKKFNTAASHTNTPGCNATTGETVSCQDYALIKLNTSRVEPRIAGKYSIIGTRDRAWVTKHLTINESEICKAGAVTGWSCGKYLGSHGNVALIRTTGTHGDSGSGLIIRTGDYSSQAYAVGILSEENDTIKHKITETVLSIIYIAPFLEKNHLSIIA